jgi:hypothetical protein
MSVGGLQAELNIDMLTRLKMIKIRMGLTSEMAPSTSTVLVATRVWRNVLTVRPW